MTDEQLREQIAQAWWEAVTKTRVAREMMPTPKQHLRLFGNKEIFLDAAIGVVQANFPQLAKERGYVKLAEDQTPPQVRISEHPLIDFSPDIAKAYKEQSWHKVVAELLKEVEG